jgi:hypothetical protein
MQTSSPRAFQLNNAFDVPLLMEMHDNDLLAISAILVTASHQISEELDRCMILAEKGDCNELKRRVHLVKPLWGFCGLPQMQTKYQFLEQFLGENPSIEKMRLRLQQEHAQIVEGLNLITAEAIRIHEFLKQPAS